MLVVLFVITPLLYAGDSTYMDDLQSKARAQKLWQDTEWLNLLHYKGKGNLPESYQSEVRSKAFFFAPDGKTNPEAELLATVAAFFTSNLPDDDSAQCKYVARFEWLVLNMDIQKQFLPTVRCDKYIEWRKHVRSNSVTLVFPAYHLNSPSSMFGHTLLRLDAAQDEGNSRWLSTAVNFGANAAGEDNSILYAYKGLVGGYAGNFVVDHYYKKIQEYNRIEQRDIWEYQLNLSSKEVERIVNHLWELQSIDFDYYYFDENCSYRLLELLEVARPGVDLTEQFKLAAIPVDTVRAIEKAGMIESSFYRPSQSTVMRHLLSQVPEQDHELIINLSKDIAVSRQPAFTQLPESRQKLIVDIAYQYLRHQQNNKQRDPLIAKRSHQLLLLLNSYPEKTSIDPDIEIPVAPEKGHYSKRLSIALGERLDRSYLEFAVKMSFHDLEDNPKGFLRGAQINMGNLQLRAEEKEGASLYKLDLIDIFSLTPRTQFLKPLAWKVYAGLERQFTKGVDQLTGHVTGGAGGSWNLLKDGQVYALAIGRLEVNKQLQRAIEPAIGFTTGVLHHFAASTARLDFSGERFMDSIYRLRAVYWQNFILSTNHSIKFSAQYQWLEFDEYSDIQLNYQYYF